MFFNKRPPSISFPGHGNWRQRGAEMGGRTGHRGALGGAGVLEEKDPWVRGSTASERLGYASSRGHARQPCREAAAVSNMVAMATWPRGTGSGRNSCRRGPRRPAPPPRARCQGDWPERGCAGGPGLLRPACTCARGLPRAGVVGHPPQTRRRQDPKPARPPAWVEKKKQNCWLFAFGKQPRLCSWRIHWFPGVEGGEPRGLGLISQRSHMFSERRALDPGRRGD